MHQNIQGIKGKELEIGLFLDRCNIDVLCLTESWLKDCELMQNVQNFTIASSFCRKTAIRGGSLIAVKNVFKFKHRIDITRMSAERDIEISCVELDKYVIVNIYRPPSGSFSTFEAIMEDILKKLSAKKYVIVLGDFNVNLLVNSTLKNNILSLFQCFNLFHQFNDPTRITATSSSCIDNVFCNCKILYKSTFTCLPSDHAGQCIRVPLNIEKPDITICKRLVNAKKIDLFKNHLLTDFESELIINDNGNECYTNLYDILIRNYNMIFPLIYKTFKLKLVFNQWATPGIRTSREIMYNLYHEKNGSTDEKLIDYVRKYSKIFKMVCKEAKALYILNKIKKSNNMVKAVWSIIKAETGQVSAQPTEFNLQYENRTLTDEMDVANTFLDFFSRIPYETTKSLASSCTEATQLMSNYVNACPNLFKFHKVTSLTIIKTFKSLKSKKSEDLWGLSIVFISDIINILAPYLAHIFNCCIDNNEFPNLMKFSKILPLFKNGSKTDPSNYRPISILPSLSKIFEKLMLQQLTAFFNLNNLLHGNQFGFSKGLSTIDAATELVKNVFDAWECSEDTIGVFCDLSKAFDCVNHEILLNKLSHYGVREDALLLMKSYLSQRSQSVAVNGVLSRSSNVMIGVPQGSILGPFLFLVYINDLPFLVRSLCDIILFADDTSLIFKVNRKLQNVSTTGINEKLRIIDNWFNVNNLMLNAKKTKCVMFSLCNNPTTNIVRINNDILSISKSTKFLGLVLDSKLQWGPHISELSAKLSSAAYAVRKIRELSDVNTAKIVYFSYFHSLMSYGLLLWGNAANANSIFILQKRAVRAIYRLSPRVSLRQLFPQMGILTMPCLYIFMTIMYARKTRHMYSRNGDSHSYETRQRHKFVLPKSKLSKVHKSFVINSVRFYNIIPQCISAENDVIFKRKLKKFLIQKAYYSVRDFICDKNVLQGFD